jgi:hypothetical protein
MVELLDKTGIAHAGAGRDLCAACDPTFRSLGELTVVIFALDFTEPHFAARSGTPGVCHFDRTAPQSLHAQLKVGIQAARALADLVFVAVHWGANNKTRPTSQTRALAAAIIAAGADAILGSSAHLLQGVEVIDGRPVLYDAGNLLFDFMPGRQRNGGLFTLSLDAGGVRRLRMDPLALDHGETRIADGNQAAHGLLRFRNRSAEFGTRVTLDGDQAVIDLPPRPGQRPDGERRPLASASNPTPPPALEEPPADCVVAAVPESAATEPHVFGPLELLGYEIRPRVLNERHQVRIESYWRLIADTEDDLWLHQQLYRGTPDDKSKFYGDHEPCDWAWPTSRWRQGIIYRDAYMLRPPYPMAPGDYDLDIGIYDPASGDLDIVRRDGIRAE